MKNLQSVIKSSIKKMPVKTVVAKSKVINSPKLVLTKPTTIVRNTKPINPRTKEMYIPNPKNTKVTIQKAKKK
jgi:hypothetical protein